MLETSWTQLASVHREYGRLTLATAGLLFYVALYAPLHTKLVLPVIFSEADEARKLRQEERRKLDGSGSGDGGCPAANGWSLPPKCHAATAADGGTNRTSIPIPVFCRPVTEAASVQVAFLSCSIGRWRGG